MPYYCTVPRCTSMAGKAKNVSFHQFPRDEELARLWNDVLKRGKPYTKYSKVCSLHFKPEDYTITSVGKNKGQWRTLRKDAVPSQNLPMETPAPYSRKQWETWSQNSTPNVIDPSIHQQMAQAIYMQTMLAMQAAGTDPTLQQNGSPAPEPQTSNQEDILKGKQTNMDCTYRCTECTKCFKDPDVFILHKRSHAKDKTNGVEKENFNMNLTLQSNPILANLLKSNNEASIDPSVISMEHLLMTALAANMDYLRNFSAVKDERDCDGLSYGANDVNCERSDVNHGRSEVNHGRSEVNHGRSSVNRDHIEVNRDRSDLNHRKVDSMSAIEDLNRLRSDLNRRSVEIHLRGDSRECKLDSRLDDSTPSKNNRYDITCQNHSTDATNFDRGHISRRESLNQVNDINLSTLQHNTAGTDENREVNHRDSNDKDLNDLNNENPTDLYHENPTDLNHENPGDLNSPLSYAMDFTSKKIDQRSGNFFRERNFSSDSSSIVNDFNDDGPRRSPCDNEFNESVDSNSLVIDESV